MKADTIAVVAAALLLFCLPKIKVTKQKGTNIKTIGVAVCNKQSNSTNGHADVGSPPHLADKYFESLDKVLDSD